MHQNFADENIDTHIRNSERGSVMMLVAIMVVTLFGMIALAIDLNRAYSGKEETTYYTRLAALGALEEYYSTDQCGEEVSDEAAINCRLEKSQLKAQELLQNNSLTVTGSSEVTLKKLSEKRNSDNAVYFEPGRWVEGESLCGQGATKPCFLSHQDNPSTSINAIRIKGSGYRGVKTIFGKLLGFDDYEFKLGVDAVASVVPRWGCFIVDISPSIMRTTHSHPFQYTYFLRDSQGGSPGNGGAWSALPDNNTWKNYMQASFVTRPAAQAGESEDPNLHYISDYRIKYLVKDADYSKAEFPLNATPGKYPLEDTLRKWAWVDTYRSATHTGPEPLTTVLNGLKEAINQFKERRVAGDKACIIFYDSRVSWNRIIPPTDDFDGLAEYVDMSISNQFLSNDIDSSSSKGVNGIAKMTRLGWYPTTGYQTDTTLAVKTALNLFEEQIGDSEMPITRFIVSIGDGLMNCVDCDPSKTDCSARCVNNYSNYMAAYGELSQIVINDMIPNSIPLHVILTGAQVGPHTVDIPMPGTNPVECYDDKAFRASGAKDPFGLTRSVSADGYDPQTRFESMAPYRPFYDAAYNMYRLAVLSRGLYGPIRPAPAPGSCNGGRITCEAGKRQMVDPYCRDEAQQMKEYTQDIIGSNPYRIVDIDD